MTARIYDVSSPAEFEPLLSMLPVEVGSLVAPRLRHEVEEISMPYGRPVVVTYHDVTVQYPVVVDRRQLQHMDTVGAWREDGRLGVEGALHRLSRETSTNRLTNLVKIRVGRALVGVAEPLRDTIAHAPGLVVIGVPGVGKTTLLRDIARITAETIGDKLWVADTSNEITGEGDAPHPIIGMASRVMIGDPGQQAAKLARIIGNMGPQRILVDEVGYRNDVELVAFAVGRGIDAIATIHGRTVADLYRSERMWPLAGRDASGALSSPPCFGVAIEVRAKGHYVIHDDLGRALKELEAGRTPVGRTVRL